MLFLQTTSGETTSEDSPAYPTAECAADPKCIYLDPAQVSDLATQMQGNTFFLAGVIGIGVLCAGLVMLILAVGGR